MSITLHKQFGGMSISMDVSVEDHSVEEIASSVADAAAILYKAEAKTMENPYLNGRVIEVHRLLAEAKANQAIPGVPLEKLKEKITVWERELEEIEKKFGLEKG